MISYTGYMGIVLFDYLEMKFQRTMKIKSGILAPLDSDQSKARFVVAQEQRIQRAEYIQDTVEGSLDLTYIITGLKNVAGSNFVIVSSWEHFYILDFSSPTSSNWNSNAYYYLVSKSINSLAFSQKEALIQLGGLAHSTLIKDTETAYCHPFCSGCSLMLSEYKCTSCTATTTLQGGICTPSASSIAAPPGGAIDLIAVTFSEDNVKPPPVTGFNIKDYYMYIIIGAGGIVGLCCLYCLFKICCGSNDEEDQQRQNQVRQGKSEE